VNKISQNALLADLSVIELWERKYWGEKPNIKLVPAKATTSLLVQETRKWKKNY
jgi:hypothetical protein